MNVQAGTVVELVGTHAWVELEPHAPACGRCEESSGCGAALAPLGVEPRRRYLLFNRIAARAGDRVEVAVPDGMVWRAAVVTYVLPLILGLGGAATGQVFGGDGPAVAGLLSGLAAGWASARLLAGYHESRGALPSLHAFSRVITVIKDRT